MTRFGVPAVLCLALLCVAPARGTRLFNATDATPVYTRNFIQDIWSAVTGAATATADAIAGDMCVHGNNCGWKCSRGMDEGEPSIDDLDAACYEHDVCLADDGDLCACDRALIETAEQIAAEDECSWWEFWCTNSDRVQNAPLVATFIRELALPYHGC